MFGSFNLISHWWPALSSRSTGWSSGAVLGLAIHALQRGRRDFDAVRMTVPSRCEVVAMTRLPTRQGVCSPTLRYRPRLAVSVRGERPAQQPIRMPARPPATDLTGAETGHSTRPSTSSLTPGCAATPAPRLTCSAAALKEIRPRDPALHQAIHQPPALPHPHRRDKPRHPSQRMNQPPLRTREEEPFQAILTQIEASWVPGRARLLFPCRSSSRYCSHDTRGW
jgi:hypothetical protein